MIISKQLIECSLRFSYIIHSKPSNMLDWLNAVTHINKILIKTNELFIIEEH